jgi:hypothetical protein
MIQRYLSISALVAWTIVFSATQNLHGAIDDVTGDVGTAQTGSVTLSGGNSGGVFDSTSSTITQHFRYLSLPAFTNTFGSDPDGRILINNQVVFHNYPSGNGNMFVGGDSGNPGYFANNSNECTAFGDSAMAGLVGASGCTAVGQAALGNLTTGGANTAFGRGAGLGIMGGSNNTLIGYGAGENYSGDENNNIILGSYGGEAGESETIHIGAIGEYSSCFIDGVYARDANVFTQLPVVVDHNGKFGTIASSVKLKANVRDMGDDSREILDLRPVSFYYKSDPLKIKTYGLIAEEVYKIFPDLVVLKDNKPFAVRYHELQVLLLNEMQKQVAQIEQLENTVKKLVKRIEKLEAKK